MPNSIDTAYSRSLIRAEMASKKLTAAYVAQQANISRETLNNFLDGTTVSPAFDRLCAIGSVVGLSPNQLAGMPDPSPEPPAPSPSADVALLVETLEQAHNREITRYTEYHAELRRDRLFWRLVSMVLLFALIFVILYFCWEILNPEKGITDILWGEYFS